VKGHPAVGRGALIGLTGRRSYDWWTDPLSCICRVSGKPGSISQKGAGLGAGLVETTAAGRVRMGGRDPCSRCQSS
jgi:hypothetical protein